MTSPEILVLQHIGCETLGTIENALSVYYRTFQYIRPFQNDPIPASLGGAKALIVMGGPMGVYEEDLYPYLTQEMKLIEQALKAGIPVLGVCLGSQLLAKTLGARVYKGKQKEIGWHEVLLAPEAAEDAVLKSAPMAFQALHWHGDIFDLPEKALPLASSALTSVQAYRYGRNVYGFLFHMEVTLEMLKKWCEVFAGELEQEKIKAGSILETGKKHLPALTDISTRVFQNWASLIPR